MVREPPGHSAHYTTYKIWLFNDRHLYHPTTLRHKIYRNTVYFKRITDHSPDPVLHQRGGWEGGWYNQLALFDLATRVEVHRDTSEKNELRNDTIQVTNVGKCVCI